MRLETTDLITISAFVKLLNDGTKIADLQNWHRRSLKKKVIAQYPELRDSQKKMYGCKYGESFDPVRGVFFHMVCNAKFIYLPLTNLQLARK